MLFTERIQEADEKDRPDRAHDAQCQGRSLELEETARHGARVIPAAEDVVQVGPHHPPEFRQLNLRLVAAKQLTAEFELELLDGARQSRLRDMTAVCGAAEVERLADRQEIPDLRQLHRHIPSCRSGITPISKR